MSVAPPSANNNPPAPGLPPVAPPNARFIVQLFLVPALIVALLVVVAMGFQYFFGLLFGTPSPDQFLKRLDDPNTEVRWRAAADLSQVLLRPNNALATDADFGLKLADRLARAHVNNKDAEQSFAERMGSLSKNDEERERKKLEGERNYIQYLGACVGNFTMPVGAPVLQELATQESGMEAKALFDQRCWALFALAVLGNKCKDFNGLPSADQATIVARLEDAIDRHDHADWAKATRDYLTALQAGTSTAMGMDVTLVKCATLPHPYERELAAFACNSWSGTDEENNRIETALVGLSFDDGHGEKEQQLLVGDNPDGTTPINLKPGRQVCYNATIALARRGSAKTRLEMLSEMLDEEQLRELFKIRQKDGQGKPNEGFVGGTLVNALKATAEMQRHNPTLVNAALREAVSKLASNKNPDIAKEAKQTLQVLGSGN